MKPVIKIDRQTGETQVVIPGKYGQLSRKDPIVLFEASTNRQKGYIVFPEGCEGIPSHMKNILIEWKKA